MGWVLLEIVIPLILAVLVGLLLGWLLWRWRRTQVTYSDWETDDSSQVSTLSDTAASEWESDKAALLTSRSEMSRLQEELAAAQSRVGRLEEANTAAGVELEDRSKRLGVMEIDLRAAETKVTEAESSLTSLSAVATAGFDIKGNVDSMLYHRPDSRNYGATGAEALFETEASAVAAGFKLAPTHPDGGTDPAESDGGTGSADGGADDADVQVIADSALAEGAELHPFGVGSHGPLAEKREMPGGYPIKGNVDSMLYHRTDSRNYGATIAEVWFDTPERAEAAGFALSPTHPGSSRSKRKR